MTVPIEQLIKPSRRAKKLRVRRRGVTAGPSGSATMGPANGSALASLPRDFEPNMFPALIPTARHSAWTCLINNKSRLHIYLTVNVSKLLLTTVLVSLVASTIIFY